MLTDAQRRLVEDNHNIVYWTLSRHHLPASEYLDVAEERLCIAAEKFSGNPQDFPKYAFVALSRALVREAYRSGPRQADIDEISVAGPNPYSEIYDRADRSRIADVCKRYMTSLERKALNYVINGEKWRGVQAQEARKRAIRKCRKHLEAVTGTFPKLTCTQAAEFYGVDRSTILRYSQARKMGKVWQIDNTALPERSKRYSKPYTGAEQKLLLSAHTDDYIAHQIGRSPNAVHIARWRLRKSK